MMFAAGTLIQIPFAIGWAVWNGLTFEQAAFGFTLPFLVAAVGWVWLGTNIYFRRRVLRVSYELEMSRLRILAEQEAETGFQREMDQISETVSAVLSRIASGDELSEDTLEEARLLEAEVRDFIRAPGLYHPLLVRSITAARRRGVDVLLLGGTESESNLDDGTAQALIAAVERTPGGRITIRKTSHGRVETISVVRQTAEGDERLSIPVIGADQASPPGCNPSTPRAGGLDASSGGGSRTR